MTNIRNTYSTLLEFSNQFPKGFDFIIHSTEKQDEHYSDLRNLKIIAEHLYSATTVIFYLSGNLNLYVIDEFFKKINCQKHKVIYVFSELNNFLSKNIHVAGTNQAVINIIELKSDAYVLLPVLMPEVTYQNHFKKLDKKYFADKRYFHSLVVPLENILKKIECLSNAEYERGTTVNLFSEDFEKVKNPIKAVLEKELMFYQLKSILKNFPQKKSHNNISLEIFHSLYELIIKFSNFNNLDTKHIKKENLGQLGKVTSQTITDSHSGKPVQGGLFSAHNSNVETWS